MPLDSNYIHKKPSFQAWNLAAANSGLRIFQTIGSIASVGLIISVGSQFTLTYAAVLSASFSSIISPFLVLSFAFNLNTSTPSIQWILWESLYIGSMTFVFLLNSITMLYCSVRWGYGAWWFATIACVLTLGSFSLDLFLLIRLQLKFARARHSQHSKPTSS